MYVKSLHFENLRGFDELEFQFVRPDNSYAGLTVFVGGNASGKSTLLKGIALNLMGPDAGRQFIGRSSGWIRSGEKRAEAKIEIVSDGKFDQFKGTGRTTNDFQAGVRWEVKEIDDVPEFRDVPFYAPNRTKIKTAERGLWDPNADGWFSAGYGPMRRLSGSSSESIRYSVGGGVVSRYVTLFREDAALSESEEWLRRMYSRTLEKDRNDRDQLEGLVGGVVSLLSDGLLPHGMRITRVSVDHVFVVDDNDTELSMSEISDGCRGIYATVLDLVHGMFEVYGSTGLFQRNDAGRIIVAKPGVVLIDEVEAHLHPSWQRDIPNWLKTHFPQIQFFVATHSPLIAQAADPNGLFVLPLQDELDRRPRQLTTEEYEKVVYGNAHKTLLGTAFGLHSTRTRWANEQIETWQRLEAKQKAGAGLSQAEIEQYSRLSGQMELAFGED